MLGLSQAKGRTENHAVLEVKLDINLFDLEVVLQGEASMIPFRCPLSPANGLKCARCSRGP